MVEEHQENTKPQLAVALAHGASVAAWARIHGVPKATAYRWSRDPEVREMVESCRRGVVERVIGQLTKRAIPAVSQVGALSAKAESESVRLSASRAIAKDLMAVSKFGGLEGRMAKIEEKLGVRVGKAGRAS
jgi:hypothetical protein